jgi:hypothetical protein
MEISFLCVVWLWGLGSVTKKDKRHVNGRGPRLMSSSEDGLRIVLAEESS